jgi:hypothetical protein
MISLMRRRRAAMMRSAIYHLSALPWLAAPLTTQVNPGAWWDILRANPGLRLSGDGTMRLVPR